MNQNTLKARTKARTGTMARSILGSAVLLSACMLRLAQAVPAYASPSQMPDEAGRSEVIFLPDESSASADSTVTGRINVQLISVEMPAGDFDFNLDAGGPFRLSDPGAQIQSPDIHVVNRSVVPVKVEISQIAGITEKDLVFSEQFSDQEEQTFRLVNRLSEVGPFGTAILVLGVSGATYSSEQEFEQYAMVPGRTNIFLTEIPAEDSRDLNLYGKITPDFYGEYSFTVRPTLKISAVQAGSAD